MDKVLPGKMRVRDPLDPPRNLRSGEACVSATPPFICLASHLISSHLFYIYIDEPGLAVPINAHYSSLLSRLWSNIPAQCPFMIETLTLYSSTAAKSLQKGYHSLREKLQSSLVMFIWRDPVCPFLGCGASRLATRWLQWLGHWAPISVYLDDRPQTW